MPTSLVGPIIAERTLQTTRGGKRKNIVVRFGQPREVEPDFWGCDVEVRGSGPRQVQTAYGIDSAQALQLAQQLARFLLQRSSSAPVTWFDYPLAMAFPQLVPAVDAKLVARIERVIKRELAAWSRDVKRGTSKRRTKK